MTSAATAGPRIPARWERLDEEFARVNGDEWVDILFDNGRWLEGPTWFPAGRYLLFSDIPNDRVLRWDETSGVVSVFRQPAQHANGHTRDHLGRLVTCEQGTRRLTRTEHDGRVVVLTDRFGGRRYNSPDVVVEHEDGTLWFSDPSFGIDSDYEGGRAEEEQDGQHVYRLDPETGEVSQVTDDFLQPNGLAFSEDWSTLYIVDQSVRAHIRSFAVKDGALSGGTVVAPCTAGTFDGIKVDTLGRIWAAAGDGVHCISPDGRLLGKLLLPEMISGMCWGGQRLNHLFVTGASQLYTLKLNINGLR